MENYYSKIKKLENELEKNRSAYNVLLRKRREKINELDQLSMLGEQTLHTAQELYIIEGAVNTVSIHINNLVNQLEYLRKEHEEYNEAHSIEFYKPMDDIDIMMTIHKNGNISGIIL